MMIHKNDNQKDTTTATPTTNPRLLWLFSRSVVPVSLEKLVDEEEEEIETTWRSDDEEEASEGYCFTSSGRASLLKYKTQKDSLSNVYPKPFVCITCDSHLKKSVRFSAVTIQSYPTILSDHPCPLAGPPVGLGWEVVDVQTMTVAQHFTSNPWRRQRKPKHFHLSSYTRERTLLTRGYTLQSLNKAASEGCKIRASRQTNALGYPAWMHPLLTALGVAATNPNSIRANTTKAVRPKGPHNNNKKKTNDKKNTKKQQLRKQEQVREWLRSI